MKQGSLPSIWNYGGGGRSGESGY